jgi:hypothetical protein
MLILFQSYFISNNFDFYLFCRTEIDNMEIIVMRIISKNLQFSSCHSSSEIPVIDHFSTGIKINFQIGKMESLFNDQIVRVPLQHEEYQRVIIFNNVSIRFLMNLFSFLLTIGNTILAGTTVRIKESTGIVPDFEAVSFRIKFDFQMKGRRGIFKDLEIISIFYITSDTSKLP